MLRSVNSYRKGTTIIEQLAILTLLGILLAVGVPAGTRLLDRAAVRSAARDALDAFASARDHAVAGGHRVAVHISASEARLVVHAGKDTMSRVLLGETHGVDIHMSRDSMAYAPTGLGWGASNLRLVISKRSESDTITLSRLGRARMN